MGDAAGHILSALMGRIVPQARAVQRNAAGGALIVLFMVTAYVALVVAAWFAVANIYGPVNASMAIAAGSLILCLLAWGVTSLLNRRAERRQLEIQRLRASVSPELQLAETALGILPELVRNKPVLTLACVALAAFAVTKSAKSK
ncbi:hypothetical protein [Allorhizobium terrae]|uniref:Uncharacterized protein n=1 Tax=Allorhizobium terrae TaxID=1848972 RepID=A0A4V3W839_9HYPH|nr:hypothetical protein [Allorhizobium terrae]THF49724.1 hypothetical protein E6C51_12350 [Allorhizobium terrae]